jgi:hypothetical protein
MIFEMPTELWKHGNPRLATLVAEGKGARGYAVPDIQRDFRWSHGQVRSLAASVLAGLPIGSVLLVKDIFAPSNARIVAQSLDRDGTVAKGAPYVLDGQQRLLALYAMFRPPSSAMGSAAVGQDPDDAAWIDRQFALKGLWYVNLSRLVSLVGRADGSDGPHESVVHRAADAQRIEGAIQRVASARLSVVASKKLLEEHGGTCIPLWMLLRKTQRQSDGAGRWREDLRARLHEQHGTGNEAVEAVLAQMALARDYCVSVELLPPLSAMRAASIFRRLNQQGSQLAGSDLVCSQFSTFDLSLRGEMRSLQRHCLKGGDRLALRGLYEEDLLEICLGIRHGQQIGPWPGRIEQRLELASNPKGVASVRAAFELLRVDDGESLAAAAEVLRACGVFDRYRWPVTNVCTALVSALALNPVSRHSESWGHQKLELIRWWWARSLQCAASGSVLGTNKLVADLCGLLRDDRWESVEAPRRFRDLRPPVDLTAPRRGSALPGQSLARLVECLLRRRLRRDFVRGDVDATRHDFDLHHIFPKKWAFDHGLGNVDVLANLALVSKVTNRDLIRAKGPREFAEQFLGGGRGRTSAQFNAILMEHGIDPGHYLAEDYEAFLKERAKWFDRALASIADGTG